MSEVMYEVWCEWDIGQDYLVFGSKEAAQKWAVEALANSDIDGETYEELYHNGLIGLKKMEVIR